MLICFVGTQSELRYEITDSIRSNGRTFVPVALDPALQLAVRWPTGVSGYGSTAKLFGEVRQCLTESGMPPEVATKVTYFLFQDWLWEVSSPTPSLIITGPSAEAALLLQLLSCASRRALRIDETESQHFRRLAQRINPTVLLDARPLAKRSLRKLLASSGFPILAPYGQSVSAISFPKVVYVGAALPGDIPSEFALHVHLAPSRRGVRLLDEHQLSRITAALQPKLLDYRLQNLPKVRASDFDIPNMDLDTGTVARCIGRCIVNAPELQHGVRTLLEDRDAELRSARWTDPTCTIVEVLLDKVHSPQPNGIFVGQVAETANALLKARGASIQLHSRGVGDVMRNLGFGPLERKAKGIRLLVTSKMIRKTHELARDYRVAAVEAGIARCPSCTEMFASAGPMDTSSDLTFEESAESEMPG
jgi:hypothetical protein